MASGCEPIRRGDEVISHAQALTPRERDPAEFSEPLRQAFFDLLTWPLLRIRHETDDARFSHALADHVHNMPELLAEFRPDRLRSCWEAERSCFLLALEEMNRPVPGPFDEPWEVIEREYRRLCRPPHYDLEATAASGFRGFSFLLPIARIDHESSLLLRLDDADHGSCWLAWDPDGCSYDPDVFDPRALKVERWVWQSVATPGDSGIPGRWHCGP